MYRISSESSEFYRRYYEKQFGLILWTPCILAKLAELIVYQSKAHLCLRVLWWWNRS